MHLFVRTVFIGFQRRANFSQWSSKFYAVQIRNYRLMSRSLDVQPARVEKIMDILDISEESAQKVAKSKCTEDDMVVLLEIIKKFGFTKNIIIQQPQILRMTPVAVENYILAMRETGFFKIEPQMINRFPVLCKRNITALQSYKMVPQYADIVKNYCRVLQLSSETEERIWEKLPSNNRQVSLFQLREVFMYHYFADALDTTIEASQKIMKTYPRTFYRSFTWVTQSIKILLDDFALPKETVRKHGYLLQANPNNLSDIISSIHTLSGVHIKKVAFCRPKILMSSKSSLLEIQSMFDEHLISHEALSKYLEIYTISPSTIQSRLEQLKRIPEFAALKQHPRVGRLIYYQNKIKSRLDYLTSNNVTGASLHILSTDRKRFDRFISVGEQRTKGLDVIHYLADAFNKSKPEIRNKLMLQPHWLQISVLLVEDSIQFLTNMNVFSKSDLFDCLPILLYPKEKVELEIANVLRQNEAKLTDSYFLHMVLYFLERQVHFTGDGVWQIKERGEVDLQSYVHESRAKDM